MATSFAPTDTFLKPNLLGLPVTGEEGYRQKESVCLSLHNINCLIAARKLREVVLCQWVNPTIFPS
jgi:hypothetical protein